MIVDVNAGIGQTMIILHASGVNSGTNTFDIQRVDEDDNIAASFVDIASAAASSGRVPSAFTANTTSGLVMGADAMQLIFSGGTEKFTLRQEGAGAVNNTLIINIRALVSIGELPAIDVTRSTNFLDVTQADTVNRFE